MTPDAQPPFHDDHRAMAANSEKRAVIELRLSQGEIAGTLRDEGGEAATFSGQLGLFTIVETWISGARDNARTDQDPE